MNESLLFTGISAFLTAGIQRGVPDTLIVELCTETTETVELYFRHGNQV